MGRLPRHLVTKYVKGIINDIDSLKEYVENCNPKAIVHSERILKTSKKALERQIIDKDKYDEWLSKVENLNKIFAANCQCLEKISHED